MLFCSWSSCCLGLQARIGVAECPLIAVLRNPQPPLLECKYQEAANPLESRCRSQGTEYIRFLLRYRRTSENGKRAPFNRTGPFSFNSLTMSYFHTGTRTIIGAKAFHCPVRDGKEWDHLAMVIRLDGVPRRQQTPQRVHRV